MTPTHSDFRHCNKLVKISASTTENRGFRRQPGFRYLEVICLGCGFPVILPPMVGLELAEKLGCRMVWDDNDYAPLEMIEWHETHTNQRVLTEQPLKPKQENAIAFLRWELERLESTVGDGATRQGVNTADGATVGWRRDWLMATRSGRIWQELKT